MSPSNDASEAYAQGSRCAWCGEDHLYVAYHDEEWGVPVHDERRLFEIVGSAVCYAFMQAVGMVNDHTIDCFRHTEIASGAGC